MIKALGRSLRNAWRAGKATFKSVTIGESRTGFWDTFRANFAHETYSHMARMVTRNPIARRAVEYIATNMASILDKAEIKVPVEDGEETVDDHPMHDLMRKPHPLYTWTWMVEGMVWQWMLAGEWWLWPFSPESGPSSRQVPQRLYLFREPDFTGFERDLDTGMVDGYHLTLPDGTDREFGADEIVHAFNYNPIDPHSTHMGERGLPLLYSVIKQVQTQQANAEWNHSIAKSGGRPPVYMMPKGLDDGEQLKKETQEDAQERIDEQWAKRSEESTPWVTSGMWEIVEAAINPEDASISEMDQRMGEKIAIGLGIPPIVLGSMEGATFSNLEWAQYMAHTQRILPLTDRFLSELNQELMPRFESADGVPEGCYITYDRRKIDALDVQTKEKAERDETLVKAGIATRDEVRPEHGLEPRGGPSDEQTVPGTIMPLANLQAPGLDDEAQQAVAALREMDAEGFNEAVEGILAGDGTTSDVPDVSVH